VSACKVCSGMEPRTVDRLLLLGYGVRFVASRFGVSRRDVSGHRDSCLVGDRRAAVVADLREMAGGEG
jgi:hypothetical protein